MKRKIALLISTAFAVMVMLCVAPETGYALDELNNTDPEKYYIKLDLNNQIVHVYEKDDDGEYTDVVRRMLCSTGDSYENPNDPEDVGTPTPTGIWKAGGRERFGKFTAFNNEYARYWTQIVEDVYFHSIMFRDRDIDELKSGAFGSLGNNVSHGCVRLYVEDAKWIYDNIPEGTLIEVTNSMERMSELKSALRTDMSFSEYDEFQKNIYDEAELPNKQAWVVVEEAAVKRGMGLSSGTKARIELGTQVEVLQESNTWAKVVYNEDGAEGYVLRAHITTEEGVMQSTPYANVVKQTAWVYSEPDTSGEFRLVKAPTHTAVKVLETNEEDNWAKVDYTGTEGFIRLSSLETDWGIILE